MVIDADALTPNHQSHMKGDPDALYKNAKEKMPNWEGMRDASIADLKEQYPWWPGPKDEAKPKKSGMLSQGASQDTRNTTPDETTEPVPTDTSKLNGAIHQGGGGDSSNTNQNIGQTDPDAITGGLQKKLVNLSNELSGLSTAKGRGEDPRRRAIEKEIATIKEMLGEV